MFDGEEMKARRLKLGLSLEGLARKLEISSKTIDNWERGASAPNSSMLVPLTEALGIPLNSLFKASASKGGGK